MPVLRRELGPRRIGGVDVLAAVRCTDRVVVGVREESTIGTSWDPPLLRVRVGEAQILHLAPRVDCDAPAAETGLFAGRNALFAIRRTETAEAASDWIGYHVSAFGADAAVIVDAGPEETDFAGALDAALGSGPPLVVVLRAGMPETEAGAVWPDLVRHRFLARARAVLSAGIADLVIPDNAGSPFDRTANAPGRVLPLVGQTVYPWRLRKGAPAPHADHVYRHAGTRIRLTGWAAAPASLPADAVWEAGRLSGVPLAESPFPEFRRAMGVVHPGLPVARMAEKAALSEDPDLTALMRRAFGREPLRRPAAPAVRERRGVRRSVTIVSAMKNEGPFILDWIAHHRALGTDRFLVYTNDCADGTDRLLDALAEAGVTRRDNPFRRTGGVPQHAAFRAAETETAVTGADWLMTLDVDEYVNIRAGEGRLADLFDAAPEADAVSLPWRLFGSADRHGYEDRPVTHLFERAAPEYAPRPIQAWAFKTLYRNTRVFRRLGVHRPRGLDPARADGFVWLDGSGRPLPPSTWRSAWRMTTSNWGYALAGINHYAVRSAESFLVKRDRGRVNHVDREQGAAYWFRMNLNAAEDRSIRRLDGKVAAERARLLALPGVAEAHAAAVAWHRTRIAALLDDPDQRAFYDLVTSPRMEKLCRMQSHFGSAVFYAGPHVIPDEIAARDPSGDFFFTI